MLVSLPSDLDLAVGVFGDGDGDGDGNGSDEDDEDESNRSLSSVPLSQQTADSFSEPRPEV